MVFNNRLTTSHLNIFCSISFRGAAMREDVYRQGECKITSHSCDDDDDDREVGNDDKEDDEDAKWSNTMSPVSCQHIFISGEA